MAIDGGRQIVSVINHLLDLPFVVKIATRDFHPPDHVSFDTSHDPPKQAFASSVVINNPKDEKEEKEIPIWPSHCVQGTKGSEFIPEMEVAKLDHIVEKGKDRRLEMFSGFADVFGNKSSQAVSQDLSDLLRRHKISHVFTVGLAGDYCVKCTALDARKEAFEVYVVEEATKSVDPGPKGWGAAKMELETHGVKIVSVDGPEIEKVKKL